MNFTQQIAKHFKDVYFGGNWTSVNFKDTLADVSWEEAITKFNSLNTIATLVFHTNYYVDVVLKVFQGEKLNASDKFSFDCPPIASPEDWAKLMSKAFEDAENFAAAIEQLPEQKLGEAFEDEKYGNYYRNIHGIIEHCHYHLGQIALIKKMLREEVN
ncbi:DinB family protein [Pinibacter aurantiacus]|uniref:DinB family protein n=1 Tax=Pinibacter aurantiacus TaxID=2851599 RepID=A0A9E2W3C7_9BACT|nr:DinB family protein [Pinibacter aurantiacus]MBV4358395.1 DinB family protein [Pinibacter aurantiacus]